MPENRGWECLPNENKNVDAGGGACYNNDLIMGV
jgi:hypothetical protein